MLIRVTVRACHRQIRRRQIWNLLWCMSDYRHGSGLVKRHKASLLISNQLWHCCLIFMHNRSVQDMIVSNNIVLFLMNTVLCHSHITDNYWLRMSATNMLRLSVFLSGSNIPRLPRIILIINCELIYGIGFVKCRLAVL